MKKIISLLCLLVLLPMSVCFASEFITKKTYDALRSKIQFSEEPFTTNFNGLAITPTSITVGSCLVFDNIDEQKYYVYIYDKLFPAYKYIGVNGIAMSFKNNTDSIAIINWRDSVISVAGKAYGMPYLESMQKSNAGNPYATPSTLIPPNQTATIEASVPTTGKFISDDTWMLYPIPIPKNGDKVVFSYYLSVTVNGQTSYVTINSPGIYIPPMPEPVGKKTK